MSAQANSESLGMSVDPNFDYSFKTVIVGNPGVGKTAFLVRYTEDRCVSNYRSTKGVTFEVKTLIRYCSFRKLFS